MGTSETSGTMTNGTMTDVGARRAFWAHAAELYGLPLSDGQLAEVVGHVADDVVVIDRLFPQLADVERQELLWSLGRHLAAVAACAGCAA